MSQSLADRVRARLAFDEHKVLAGFEHNDLTESEIDLTLIGAIAENARNAELFSALVALTKHIEKIYSDSDNREEVEYFEFERFLKAIDAALGEAE